MNCKDFQKIKYNKKCQKSICSNIIFFFLYNSSKEIMKKKQLTNLIYIIDYKQINFIFGYMANKPLSRIQRYISSLIWFDRSGPILKTVVLTIVVYGDFHIHHIYYYYSSSQMNVFSVKHIYIYIFGTNERRKILTPFHIVNSFKELFLFQNVNSFHIFR